MLSMNSLVPRLAKWVVQAVGLLLGLMGITVGVVSVLGAFATNDRTAIILCIFPLLLAGLFVAVAWQVLFRYSGEVVAKLIGFIVFGALAYWMQSRFPIEGLRDDGVDMREWALFVLDVLVPITCGWLAYRVMRILIRNPKVEAIK